MEYTPPPGTLWELLSSTNDSKLHLQLLPQQQPLLLPLPPPVPTKEVVEPVYVKSKLLLGAEKSTTLKFFNQFSELFSFEIKAYEELVFLVEEALKNHDFSPLPKETKSHLKSKVSDAPHRVSIWGVPLLKDDRTDAILLKFLKARQFNVKQSFAMLRNTVKWRREFGIDDLMEQSLDSDIEQVSYVLGNDKEMHPVWYEASGELKNKELFMKYFIEENRKSIQFLEGNVRKFDFSPGGGTCAFLLVSDLKNSPGSRKKEFRIATNQLHQLLNDHYPGFVARQVFINVPAWYLFYFSVLIRPFLTDDIKSKFIFAGPSKTADTLLMYISPENLPIQYGGLICPYPNDTSNAEFTANDSAIEMEIKPDTKKMLSIPIDKDYAISWELRVLEWGVSYDVEFIPVHEDSYNVILFKKKKMLNSDSPVLSDKFKAGESGRIAITIHNPTSKSKRLIYRFKITPIHTQ